MIDTSSEGIRCRAVQDIKSHHGVVRASTEGTIDYEVQRLGHPLIRVHWDNGLSLHVSPSQIEIIDGALLWQ